MPRPILAALLTAFAVPLPAAAQQAVQLSTEVLHEQREPADGTGAPRLTPAHRAVPGDRLVYRIAYRNDGAVAAEDVVIANPLPAGMTYAGTPEGMPEPEVSVDGTRFAALAQLRVAGTDGQPRAATFADVRAVRWHVRPIAPRSGGTLAFRATLD